MYFKTISKAIQLVLHIPKFEKRLLPRENFGIDIFFYHFSIMNYFYVIRAWVINSLKFIVTSIRQS